MSSLPTPLGEVPAHSVGGPAGLTTAEAQRRLSQFGPNEIRRDRETGVLTLVLRQFASPVIWLLVGASVVSLALGELLRSTAGCLQLREDWPPRGWSSCG